MGNTCTVCGTELKELFFSRYCPNEENHGRTQGHVVDAIDYDRGVVTFSSQAFPQVQPAPPPGIVFHQRFDFPPQQFVLNQSTKLYYAYHVFYVPSVHLHGWNIAVSGAGGYTAYVSGQHKAPSGKKMEITLVVEGAGPPGFVSVDYRCTYV